jgi:hypothetical protein
MTVMSLELKIVALDTSESITHELNKVRTETSCANTFSDELGRNVFKNVQQESIRISSNILFFT